MLPHHQQVHDGQHGLLVDPRVPGEEAVHVLAWNHHHQRTRDTRHVAALLGLRHPSSGSSSLSGSMSFSPYSENIGRVLRRPPSNILRAKLSYAYMTGLLHEGKFHVGDLREPAIFESLPWAYVMCNWAQILVGERH